MKNIFIETSVWVRFLVFDDPVKAKDCQQLFEKIAQGKFRPYISNIVILEIIFVLTRLYKFSKEQVLKDLKTLFLLRNLSLIERTNTYLALQIFSQHNIKFGDCFIAAQVPQNATLVSYDSDFSKVSSLKVTEPKGLT